MKQDLDKLYLRGRGTKCYIIDNFNGKKVLAWKAFEGVNQFKNKLNDFKQRDGWYSPAWFYKDMSIKVI